MTVQQAAASLGSNNFKRLTDETSPAGEIYMALLADGADATITTADLVGGNANSDDTYTGTITAGQYLLGRFENVEVVGTVLAYFEEG
jgi:hypothetical protein